MWLYFPLFLIGTIVSCGNCLLQRENMKPRLLIVNFAGLSPDDFNKCDLPNITKIREKGVTAKFFEAIMPPESVPNDVSIVSGLYAELHGSVSDELFDPMLNKKLGNEEAMFKFNKHLVPIYTLNQLMGGHSGSMMWRGGEYSYKNVACTHIQKYDEKMAWNKQVKKVVEWFNHPQKKANFVLMDIRQPDADNHIYGREHEQLKDTLRKVDNLMGYIDETVPKDVSVMYVSNHGMEDVQVVNLIDLNKFIHPTHADIYGISPFLQIVPKPGQENNVWQQLTIAAAENGHFKVYTCQTIPPEWHVCGKYSLPAASRYGPIFVVADSGFSFSDITKQGKLFENLFDIRYNLNSRYGVPGFNSRSSRYGIFIGKGEIFKENKTVEGFKNVDLYHLICHILRLQPISEISGQDRQDIWREMLKEIV